MSREMLRRTVLSSSSLNRISSSSSSLIRPTCSPSSSCSHVTPHRALHYILQRDSDKIVPPHDIFIRTPETAPVLSCLSYSELETTLRKHDVALSSPQILTGRFVVNAVRDTTSDKLIRKERGVATLVSRVKDTRILAVCDTDSHAEVMSAGAARCVAPESVSSELTSVEEYEAVVCTSAALGALRSLGKVLKSKMPHERRGTVAPNIMSALRHALLNVEWEMTQSSNHPHYYNVTLPLIKSDFPAATIKDHVAIMFSEIMNFCPAKSKPEQFIERLELNWLSRDTSDTESLVASRDTLHIDIREHTASLKPAVEATVLKKRYSREETWALRDASKDRIQYLDEEKDKIAHFLEDRWKQIGKHS